MRKLCWFALPFCAAVLAAVLGLPLFVLLPAGLTAAVLGIWAVHCKRPPVCLACLGLAFGLLWTQCYAQIFRAPAQALDGQTVNFTATVIDWPRETSVNSVSMTVRLHLDDAPDPKAVLYANSPDLSFRPGDVISGTARFQSTDVVRGEQTTYYEAQGIHLRAGMSEPFALQRPGRLPVSAWPAYAAQHIKESIRTIFPTDVSGFICALLTGDKSDMSTGDYAALRRTGAAHIVAVSGLHLSFFAGFLSLFFRRHSKLGAALTILLIFLFAAVAGFTPSILRAAFMTSLTVLAPLVGRENDSPTTLTTALFVLLFLNPYSVSSVSLQLSFAAVAGIHLVSQPLHRAMTHSLTRGGSFAKRLFHRALHLLCANLSVTLGSLLFTTPLCAYYFGSVSLIAPVTNLLVLWTVSLAFAPGLILTLFGIALPGLSAVLTFPVTLLTRYILTVSRVLSSLSFASVTTDSFYLCAWLVLVYLILLWVLLHRGKRPILPICAGTVAFCAALLLTRLSATFYPLTVTMLDVGQGQSILLTCGGYTALIDCGGTKENAGDIAADHLQSLGISELDLLVLTHCHSDHANGVSELFARVEISSLILPALNEDESTYRSEILALAESEGTEILLLSDNRALSFGETTLTLYAPLGDGGANEEGLFVLATCADFDLLVTGDVNDYVETLLIKYNDLPDIEVLVAGHHGSHRSTSETLLDAVTPEICLISVGYNVYGHPTDETLQRLSVRGIDIYRTDLMGNLTVRYKGES